MKKIVRACGLVVGTLVLSLAGNAQTALQKKIESLINRMTLDEKILQLNQYTAGLNTNPNNIESKLHEIPAGIGSLILFSADPEFRNRIQKKAMDSSRLGIPILFGFDIIHGCRTLYPIPLAQACSWNPELVTKASAVAAREARLSGTDWTFSPMIDVAYDPRWGRVAEGYGEDPYTNAVFCVATVKGYQGTAPYDSLHIASCLKHFVGYSRSEGGRDYHYSDVSPQSLWETYLPPYEAGIKAGAATVMSGFNDISGVPATANHYLLTKILKEKWGHKGFVVSDWEAVVQLMNQGVAKDKKEAAQKAFLAGVEMNMLDNVYREHLPALIKEGKVPLAAINEAVRRILRLKFELGLFDRPYTTVIPESSRYLQAADLAVAEKLAEESMVLLKNRNNVLPFSSSVKKLAVIGPIAKDSANIMGSWTAHGKKADTKSFWDGMKEEFSGNIQMVYAKGCDFDGSDTTGFAAAAAAAQGADAVVLCFGEKREWSGENASRSSIALPAVQEALVKALSATGKPIVLILSNGRPLELVRIEPQVDAIVEAWQPGTAGAKPLAGILSGRVNPSGKLAITFPLTSGQIPIHYNRRQPSRIQDGMGNYQDVPTKPLYAFGYGLSYTSFDYGNLQLSSTRLKKGQTLRATITVKNTGVKNGSETVHWYIADPFASISRPLKELKHFEKKPIRAGETVTYSFTIDPLRDVSFPDAEGNRRLEEGEFYLLVGEQKVKFELVK